MKRVSSKSLKYSVYSLFLILVMSIFGSCSKDDDNLLPSNPNKPTEEVVPDSPEEEVPKGDEEMYEAYYSDVQDIYDKINSGLISNNEELKTALQNNDNVVDIEEDNGILYVNFRGDWQFMADFEGKCAVKEGLDYDESQLEELIKEWDEFDQFENDTDSYLTRSNGIGDSKIAPRNYNVLLWAPCGNMYGSHELIKNICDKVKDRLTGEHVINLEIISGNNCSPQDLRIFSSYDIVIFQTHGTPEGKPIVPMNFTDGISLGTNFWYTEGNVLCQELNYNFLTYYLPNLQNTVIWTLMCYSYVNGSELVKVMRDKSAGDYFGGTDQMNTSTNLNFFTPFLFNLYKGASSKDAFYYGTASGVSYSFTDTDGTINGVFGSTTDFKGVCFPFTYVRQSNETSMTGCWQAPVGELDKVLSGNGKFRGGVELKNKETGEKITKELLNDNIDKDKIERKNYRNIVEGIKVEFKTDDLPEGNYSYATYIIYPDGKKEYSENEGSLIIAEGNYIEMTIDFDANEWWPKTLFSLEGNDIEITKITLDGINCEYDENMGIYYLDSYVTWYILDNYHKRVIINPNIKYFTEGVHRVKCYYTGELKAFRYSDILGGILPATVERVGHLWGNTKKISTKSSGDNILTIPVSIKSYDNYDDEFGGSSSNLSANKLEILDFSGCSSLSSIGDWAFSNCQNLSSVDFSGCSSLSLIGDYAFNGCSSLSSVNFSGCASLTSIGDYTFNGCSSLSSVNFSGCSSLSSIGDWAFSNCSNLQSVNFDDTTVQFIPVSAFFHCDNCPKN